MNLALSLKFWLGIVIGANLSGLLLLGAQTFGIAQGFAGLCIGALVGCTGLVALITARNRRGISAHIED